MQQNSDVLQTLIGRIWIAILGLVLGAALGALVSQQMAPVYQSSVYLLVVPASDNAETAISDDTDRRLRSDYAQAFSRLATEPAVIGEAVGESEVGVDPEHVEEVVNVVTSPNAPILEITANFQDSVTASVLANALGNELSSFTEERAEDTGYWAEVMAEAAPPAEPAAPGWNLNIAVGAAAGLLVGGVVALLWDGLLQPLRQLWEAGADSRRARSREKENQRRARQKEKDRRQRREGQEKKDRRQRREGQEEKDGRQRREEQEEKDGRQRREGQEKKDRQLLRLYSVAVAVGIVGMLVAVGMFITATALVVSDSVLGAEPQQVSYQEDYFVEAPFSESSGEQGEDERDSTDH